MASATTPAARREDGAPSNWDRYLDLLARRGVPEKFRRWYVRRVEDLLKAVRPDSLARLSAQQVSSYLQQVLSRKGPADWQFGQVVDALQLLLVDLAQAPAGKSVDWAYWKEGGRGLEPDYPTIAKSSAPVSGPRFARPVQFFPLLETLGRTIRSMPYSIRTEQAYVEWCHRFLAFCGDKDPAELGREDVQRFLSHLAVERSVSANTQSLAYNAVAFLFKQVLERPWRTCVLRRPSARRGCRWC